MQCHNTTGGGLPADTTLPHFLDGDTIYTSLVHPSLTHSLTHSLTQFISILSVFCIITFFKPYSYNIIFYVCKLVLVFFVTYPSQNTSLKMVTKGGRNKQEACSVYNVTNSHIFICIWLYSHNEQSNHSLNHDSLLFHISRNP